MRRDSQFVLLDFNMFMLGKRRNTKFSRLSSHINLLARLSAILSVSLTIREGKSGVVAGDVSAFTAKRSCARLDVRAAFLLLHKYFTL